MKELPVISSWGIGLSAGQVELLRAILGEEHSFLVFPEKEELSPERFESSLPSLVWVASRCRGNIFRFAPELSRRMASIPKILLLDPGYVLEDFEAACDQGFSAILRPPFSRGRILEILHQAIKAQTVQYDIACMTREILLERELLERKNEILEFLVNFMTLFTNRLDLEHLLQIAHTGLGRLLPIRTLHAALWEYNNSISPDISLYISAPTGSKARDTWKNALLTHAGAIVGSRFSLVDIHHLSLKGQTEADSACLPGDGSLISLPLRAGTEQIGLLLSLTAMERPLGKDQVTALESAMRHLSFNIKNARRFHAMQRHADCIAAPSQYPDA